MTPTQIQALAAAAAALRPDWPANSVATFLSTEHSSRPYRDVAVALVWVACDPATAYPKRMNEAGPWWRAAAVDRAAAASTGAPPHDERCPLPGHGSYPADNCGACRSEQIGTPVPRKAWDREEPSYVVGPKLVREAMRQAGIPVKPRTQP
jgi:hypothetical protein